MSKIKIGDKFQLNFGVEVTVIEYITCYNIIVECSEGFRKSVSSDGLRKGNIRWRDARIKHFAKILENDVKFPLTLKCGVEVHLVQYDNTNKVLIRDDFGNSKYVTAYMLRNNHISWYEFGFHTRKVPEIGSIQTSEKYGDYIVTGYDPISDKISIVWQKTGVVKENISRKKFFSNSIIDSSQQLINTQPKGYYVYVTTYEDVVLYVGKGLGRRYLHTLNGCSHVFGLNEMFFKGQKVTTNIHKDNLSEKEAYSLELELLKLLIPKFNVHNKISKS